MEWFGWFRRVGGTIVRGRGCACPGGVVPTGELHDTEHDDEEGDRGHHEAEDDIARRLDPGFTTGEAPRIDLAHGSVADDQRDVGKWVEDCVGHGCEEGQRPGRGGAVDLQRGEHEVRNERAVDGNLVFEMVFTFLALCITDVVVHRLQPSLDILVLGFVKIL